jgi:hypothetical protein
MDHDQAELAKSNNVNDNPVLDLAKYIPEGRLILRAPASVILISMISAWICPDL